MTGQYHSTLAVDLCEWTFDISIETPTGDLLSRHLEIPPAGLLRDLCQGRKRLRLTVGRDIVTIPEELFEALFREIKDCQNTIRRHHAGAYRHLD
jgi:hypothetical protein